MKTAELAEKLELKLAAGADGTDREVSGCYIGDLMSLAMARVEENNVWITIQSNVNVVAVSSLTEAGCVILADGVEPDASAAEKANAEGIPIFTSDKSAYELAKLLGAMGI